VSHTVREKQKLLNRVRRIRGQVEAIERSLEGEGECAEVMQLISATRGAINGLLAEVLEEHVRDHLAGRSAGEARAAAADELIDVIHAYFR
jgi:DNA-binding FrmR family transcriptional regulator